MIAYTDGATSNNGSNYAVGGWAFVIVNNNNSVIDFKKGKLVPTTNNICELTAIINACIYLDYKYPSEEHIIYTDSAYVVNCYKQKWYKKWQENGWITSKKTAVLNQSLWEKLIPFFEKENFTFEKVKGHFNNNFNNLADKLAVEAKQQC